MGRLPGSLHLKGAIFRIGIDAMGGERESGSSVVNITLRLSMNIGCRIRGYGDHGYLIHDILSLGDIAEDRVLAIQTGVVHQIDIKLASGRIRAGMAMARVPIWFFNSGTASSGRV